MLNHSTRSTSPSALASSLAHEGRFALDASPQRRRTPAWRTARVAALAAARRARSALARRVLITVYAIAASTASVDAEMAPRAPDANAVAAKRTPSNDAIGVAPRFATSARAARNPARAAVAMRAYRGPAGPRITISAARYATPRTRAGRGGKLSNAGDAIIPRWTQAIAAASAAMTSATSAGTNFPMAPGFERRGSKAGHGPCARATVPSRWLRTA